MTFLVIVGAGIGGGIAGFILLVIGIIAIRSRVRNCLFLYFQKVKWVDSIGINLLTSKKNGMATVTQDILTFQNQVTYESFLKKWSVVLILHSSFTYRLANYPVFIYPIKKRRFLWSY